MANSTGLRSAITRLVTKRLTIVACEPLARDMVLLTLEGAALIGASWKPGQKLQIAMGSAFDTRTYTPIDWDARHGRTRILGFAHGSGPGSDWLRDAKVGDTCDVLGPRRSISDHGLQGPIAVFGDETSLGLACALARDTRTLSFHFEVGDVAAIEQVVARLGLRDATLVSRMPEDGHLEAVAAVLRPAAAAGWSFMLTGRALLIQRLRVELKQLEVPAERFVTKAYWAPGKAGLD